VCRLRMERASFTEVPISCNSASSPLGAPFRACSRPDFASKARTPSQHPSPTTTNKAADASRPPPHAGSEAAVAD
jgi:hypothetical protein